ncbi:unnamed protein product [Rhizophagus irregularis]|nr:unnamed protein product [Rhizophagus irregularis]CAB5387260.1 unnamed protein product [Rhizophagus irregularis]
MHLHLTPLPPTRNFKQMFINHPISDINWPLTQSWLNHNDTKDKDTCSTDKSNKTAFKLKCLNHILPCGEMLASHYPSLYSPSQLPIKCPICKDCTGAANACGFNPRSYQQF